MRLRAYGLEVDCRVPLPGLPEDAPRGAPDLIVLAGEPDWSGPSDPPRRIDRAVDGRPLTIERGRAGDVRLTWGEEGRFLIDPAAGEVHAAGDGGAPWRRVLLDTVLGTAMLARGGHALHGGAVVIDGGAVAITGPSGAGKTSLVLALLRRGHALLADDIVALEATGAGFLAHPAPPVMNVPVATAGALPRLADLGDEAWVVAPAAREPVPLRAVVLLARGTAARVALVALPDPAVPLLSVLFGTGMEPGRMAAHFDLAAALAARVPPLRLTAPSTAAPDTLAAALLAQLHSAGADR